MESLRPSAAAELGEPAPAALPGRGRWLRRLALPGLLALTGAVAASLSTRAGVVSTLGTGTFTSPGAPTSGARSDLPPLPARLSETGLYVPGSTREVHPQNLSYVPQYPLWSDGASKRRWMRLPEGQRVDASDPDRFRFPVGTRFWKEFSFDGVRTETRYMELTAAGFRYATYVWNAAGTDAELAPELGIRGLRALEGGVRHDIPSQSDCTACHAGRPSSVLGFTALQLSPDRDPLAPHAEPVQPGDIDLPELERRGLIDHLPPALLGRAPRIAASSPTERATLGYLYANCGHCHNADGPLAALGLDLDVLLRDGATAERARASSVAVPSRYRLPEAQSSLRVQPGAPDASVLAFRMREAAPAARMPPLGTRLVDTSAVALVERWINEDL